MARLESQAVAGYFRAPDEIMELIAGKLTPREGASYFDPCAGEGLALSSLKLKNNYAIEMEKTRFEALRGVTTKSLHGDAFTLHASCTECFSLMWLNPPYDYHPEGKRLEEMFLRRFTSTLVSGGYLLFFVPHYALEASAETISLNYEEVSCWKVPDPHFEVYKQVVLVAKKRATPLFEPDLELKSRVEAWSNSVEGLPLLGEAFPTLTPPKGDYVSDFVLKDMDFVRLLASVKPWHRSSGRSVVRVEHILPHGDAQAALVRTYPVAMPLRPVHMAAAIAAGVFNGRRLQAKDQSLGLPDLLVKGAFDKEYRTVEEKQNKEGVVTSVTQVQEPKLVVTVMNINTGEFHTLKSLPTPSGSLSVSDFTTADLLEHYSTDLLRAMQDNCPSSFKLESDTFDLIPTIRPLYQAQANAARAAVKLLGGPNLPVRSRNGKAAYILGEIGSGKTLTTITVALTCGAKSVLVMCPPHLLSTWEEEVKKTYPIRTVVLSDVAEVDKLASSTEPFIAILSKETAKLSHGWATLSGHCPKCACPLEPKDFSKKRERCKTRKVRPADDLARSVVEWATALRPYTSDPKIIDIPVGRMVTKQKVEGSPRRFNFRWLMDQGLPNELLGAIFHYDPKAAEVYLSLGGEQWGLVAMALPERAEELMAAHPEYSYGTVGLKRALEGMKLPDYYVAYDTYSNWSMKDGVRKYMGWAADSVDLLVYIVRALAELGQWKKGSECGEVLYQAVPSPRRVAIGDYIVKRHPNLFDFLILDESHQYSHSGSAQEVTAHRLTNLNKPVVLMTGSVMNGYAQSLFANMWATYPQFRKEFKKEEESVFVERYGYLKRQLQDKERGTGTILEFGSNSDRVERSIKITGQAPGVLPVFILRYLLAQAVTIQKADLAVDIPKLTEEAVAIPCEDLKVPYQDMVQALVSQIKEDRFTDRAGKLMGALTELPSYLDRSTADTGNTEDGDYVLKYPETEGGTIFHRESGKDPSKLSEKETWLLSRVRAELDEGRNVMVFGYHRTVLVRLQKILSRVTPTVYLDSEKVNTAKRQAWIDKEVVKKNIRVLVVNPVAVETGLNNLVRFATQIWVENPACNPTTYRQACGRSHRIGQKQPVRIFFPFYAGTLQDTARKLLLHKVAVSLSADGLDGESALQAAGIAESTGYTSGSVGKQLWQILEREGLV